jgi:hypothetical protein
MREFTHNGGRAVADALQRFGRQVANAVRGIMPPPGWMLPVVLLLGMLVGLGGLVFHVSRASSYLSDNPTDVRQLPCHGAAVRDMVPTAGIARSATCNDCHVPHDNPFCDITPSRRLTAHGTPSCSPSGWSRR